VWPHRSSKHVSCDEVRKMLKEKERYAQQNYPTHEAKLATRLLTPDVADCWPNCNEE
jgi:hypothetical protein